MKGKLLFTMLLASIGLSAQTTHHISWSMATSNAQASVTIPQGDIVTWTWADAAPHTVTSNAGGAESFASAQLTGNGQTFSLDFSFTQTVNPVAFGICQEPHDFVSGNQRYVIESQDGKNSLIYFRMQTTIKAEMMPPIGRSTEDTKALMLIREWIDTMETPCE